MKKGLVVGLVVFMLCFSMAGIASSQAILLKADEIPAKSIKAKDPISPNVETMEIVRETVDRYLTMDEYLYQVPEQQSPEHYMLPQPVLGNGEIFGLWITIEYNGQQFSEKVDISPWLLKGKLSDPNYRTPIKFDVDSDPANDIEAGFGFFRYGIDEITDSGTVNHPAWATAFDFMQINGGLDDPLAELEVWQEFHVDLGLIKNSASSQSQQVSTKQTTTTSFLLQRIVQRMTSHASLDAPPLPSPLLTMIQTMGQEATIKEENNNPSAPLPAAEDYIVTRVGYRSRSGDKIPLRFQKTFAVGKDNIFRPAIFQHEMDPNDVIGTASTDVLFGFQAFQEGMTQPTYDVEFCVNFDPACYVVTQLTPLSGKTFFYYHSASAEQTDITFSSNLLKGGSTAEEENATFTFTLSLDSVPNELVGPGKWMSFNLNLIGEGSPLSGNFQYRASDQFNVGFTIGSPWFEEKISLKEVPETADFEWGLDAVIDIVQGEFLYVETIGFVSLTMSSNLEAFTLFYPKADPAIPDVKWISVEGIPSSRYIEAGASLDIDNSSMLRIDVEGYVEHDTDNILREVSIYYPKADPYSDPDMLLFQIPDGSFANQGRAYAEATLYVDPDPTQFWNNSANYFYAKAGRTASSDFGEANFYLPNIPIPLVQVSNIPGDSYGKGQFWWNQLKADLRAERSSSSGEKDPITFNLVFDDLLISDEVRIGNGHIDVKGKIAEDGYFELDTSNDMLNNYLTIENQATQNGITISAGTISAENFAANWDLDMSGPQVQLEELAMTGKLTAFKNFAIDIEIDGDDINFDGDWSVGESGSFEIDFYQIDPLVLSFDLDDYSENIDLHGYVLLDNDLHFDVSWRWEQGGYLDPAYFKINENSNQANLQELNLYFTYNDLWGADITFEDLCLYVCVEWYWHNAILYIWPVFSISGDLDLHLLLNGNWYYNVEDNWP